MRGQDNHRIKDNLPLGFFRGGCGFVPALKHMPYIDNNHIKMLKSHYIVYYVHRTSKTHGLVFKIIKKL